MDKTQREKLHDLLSDFATAVLVTHGGQDGFRARPMAVAGVDEDDGLWFIASKESAKAHEIEKDTRVSVICQSGWASCVCITGRATLSQDRAKLKELWKVSYQVWFPLGVDDPDIVLIHVIIEQGEYWDNSGANRFTYAYQAVKAIVTGATPDMREGVQHGQIKLAE